MWHYYLYFILIFVLFVQLEQQTKAELNSESWRVRYLLWVVGIMWIMVGFRDIYMGVDTQSYVNAFRRMTDKDLKEVSEPLYYGLSLLIKQITEDYHIYFTIIQTAYFVGLYWLLRKYLKNSYEIFAAVNVLFLLGLYAFSVAAVRQMIALGFVMMAFIAADESKWKRFLIFIALAYGFHNSALYLVVLYGLRYIDLKRYGFLLILGIFALGYSAPDIAKQYITMSMGDSERFAAYGSVYESSQNYTGFFLQLILVAVAFWRKEQIQLEQKTKNLFFNCAFIGLGIQSLTVIIAEMYRMSFYFCAFDIVLIPLALSTFKGPNAKMIRTCFIIGCLIYIFILSGFGVLPIADEARSNWH